MDYKIYRSSTYLSSSEPLLESSSSLSSSSSSVPTSSSSSLPSSSPRFFLHESSSVSTSFESSELAFALSRVLFVHLTDHGFLVTLLVVASTSTRELSVNAHYKPPPSSTSSSILRTVLPGISASATSRASAKVTDMSVKPTGRASVRPQRLGSASRPCQEPVTS